MAKHCHDINSVYHINICHPYMLITSVGSQIVAHTLTEAGNGPNRPNTIDL